VRKIGTNGIITTVTYDSAGHLASVTDPLGRTVIYAQYDAQGRVTQQILPGGRVVNFQYDAAGNLT
jgi:YD repeat-containing protein